MTVRPPSAAGLFYSAAPDHLSAEVARLLALHQPKRVARAKAVIVPHAGYMYSGGVAAQTYASIEVPQTVVLLGPDHFGVAQAFSVFHEGVWETPLGEVAVDVDVAKALLRQSPLLTMDNDGHAHDHCLEVQLPFLQKLNPAVRIVPILVGAQDAVQWRTVGIALGEALAQMKPCPLLLASSDLNHYEPLSVSEAKDRRVIKALLELAEDNLLRECREHHITMCGIGPAFKVLVAAKRLGAQRAELIEYRTSADAGGDESAVVGYAGIMIW